MSIDKLSAVSVVTASDAVALFSASLGADARATLATLLTWLQEQLTATGGFVSAYLTPLTGFSTTVTPVVTGDNVFLLLTPAGTLATGTIVLPTAPVHAQEIMVASTQTVTTLTVSAGSYSVSGAPTTITTTAPFRVRFDAILGLWVRVL